MKLSLAWLFDHINADWHKIDVPVLIDLFNKTTAEIEQYERVRLSFDHLSLAEVKDITAEQVTLVSHEWQQSSVLPRTKEVHLGQQFLIKKENTRITWANGQDCGASQPFVLPAFWCPADQLKGGWKKQLENEDYLIHLDNKSINHRPDMWGHRGVAREIAAMLNLPLKPLQNLIAQQQVKQLDKSAPKQSGQPIEIRLENPERCKRIAVVCLDHIENRPSLLPIAFRLLKTDQRPLNALIDFTNYVMIDIGQPMHVFDAAKLSADLLTVRQARNKEMITLLDDQTVQLTDQDIVITDGSNPISLAGISGGKDTGVTAQTKAILVESAAFDAATIRKTATRVKRRTESSTRFEKSLDPNQNVTALLRYLFLAQQYGLPIHVVDDVYSVGAPIKPKQISVAHHFIERLLGTSIPAEFVIKTLRALAFDVTEINGTYHITVPTFRTKDISIEQDIVEEIGRFFGYQLIPTCLPMRAMQPFDLSAVERKRRIKYFFAYSMQMHELYSYAFFDESFLNSVGWEPLNALRVQSAVSENWQRLVTTLMPNLFKAVQQELAVHGQVRFFEWARIWQAKGEQIVEQQTLSGIIADRNQTVDFYYVKNYLHEFFAMIGLDVSWVKVEQPTDPWYMPFQTARLMHQNVIIGTVGKVHPQWYQKIASGDACIFELDAGFLHSYQKVETLLKPLSKYPHIERDMSMLVPRALTVDQLTSIIAMTNKKIIQVSLLDFFEKPEWQDQKSLTFRFVISEPEKTLTYQEADAVWEEVAANIKAVGGTIR